MKKWTLLLPLLCLHTSLTLAQTTTPQPEGDGTRVDDRTERRMERRTTMMNASPEERAALRQERRDKIVNYRQTSEGAAQRIERRENRRGIRQETRAGGSN